MSKVGFETLCSSGKILVIYTYIKFEIHDKLLDSIKQL